MGWIERRVDDRAPLFVVASRTTRKTSSHRPFSVNRHFCRQSTMHGRQLLTRIWFVHITLRSTREVAGDATQVQKTNERNRSDRIRHHSDVGVTVLQPCFQATRSWRARERSRLRSIRSTHECSDPSSHGVLQRRITPPWLTPPWLDTTGTRTYELVESYGKLRKLLRRVLGC